MEAQDETELANEYLKSEAPCSAIQTTNASGSGSDDNGEDPPFSFSIHTEQQLLPEKLEEDVKVNTISDTDDILSPNEDRDDELEEEEEEQPPVTWFVTKPNYPSHEQPAHPHHMFQHCQGMEWQQSRLCKLCLVRRKKFYCITCVNNGEFSHSNARYPGNLSEKKDQHAVIEKKTESMINDIKNRTETRVKCQKLEEDIRMNRQRINYLQKLIQATKDKKDKTTKHTRKLGAMNDAREQRLPLFIDKVSKIRQYTKKYFGELDKEKMRVAEKNQVLDALRQNHVKKLFELVFPVEKVIIKSSHRVDHSVSEASSLTTSGNAASLIESLMVDAMSTSYVNGQGWITLSPDQECHNSNPSTLCDSSDMKGSLFQNDTERVVYKIAGPYLPADGDYSRFPTLVKVANDQVQSIIPQVASQPQAIFPTEIDASRAHGLGMELTTEEEISAVYTISAGLTVSKRSKFFVLTYAWV